MSRSSGWLLDTNVLSELRKPSPDISVVTFIRSRTSDSLFVSSVTLAEIRFGIEAVEDIQHRATLQAWLSKEVRPLFAHSVLPITEDIIFRWRVLVEQGRKRGHTFSQPDLFIAATAIEHRLSLVTRNIRDFEFLQIDLVNPWSS